jgi:hypothetical protein
MARCTVLKYAPFTNAKGKADSSYMDVDPTSATYSDSELRVRFPTSFPKGWDFGADYTLVIDNGIGKASVGKFKTVASSDSNNEPDAFDDTFNGANAIAKDSVKNKLDILDNDEFPNADYVDLKIITSPDAGGKVKWDKGKGVLIYTPAPGFTGIENLTYQITEKYTDQHAISTASVAITVQ